MPIAMSYDRPAEEGALVTELSGIPKEKESLASLLAAAGSLAVGGSGRKAAGRKAGGSGGGREAIGADIMRVGEIVTLERFLMARRSGAPCSQQKIVMLSRMLGEAQVKRLLSAALVAATQPVDKSHMRLEAARRATTCTVRGAASRPDGDEWYTGWPYLTCLQLHVEHTQNIGFMLAGHART